MTKAEVSTKNNIQLMREFLNDPPLTLAEFKLLPKEDQDELVSMVRAYYNSIVTE